MHQLTKYQRFVGAMFVAVSALAIAAPAQARGIVADITPAHLLVCDAIACGISTPGVPIVYAGRKFYVYTDGYVSVDVPLANPPGGKFPTAVASLQPLLGSSYLAAGLYPYKKGKGIPLRVYYRLTTAQPALDVIYYLPSASFQIWLHNNPDGSFTGQISQGDGVLPNNAITGSSYAGCKAVDLLEPILSCDLPGFPNPPTRPYPYTAFKPGLTKVNKKYIYFDDVVTIPAIPQ